MHLNFRQPRTDTAENATFFNPTRIYALLIFNLVGMVELIAAFGIAFLIGHLIGKRDEPTLMVIAGPILAFGDVGYRMLVKEGHWIRPNQGGMLFFLPVWPFGLFWLGWAWCAYSMAELPTAHCVCRPMESRFRRKKEWNQKRERLKSG